MHTHIRIYSRTHTTSITPQYGEKQPESGSVLSNVQFFEEDLNTARSLINNSVVVCLHGCNEVNQIAIEMALETRTCGYVVMPCCIQKDMYLDQECHVNLMDDNMR